MGDRPLLITIICIFGFLGGILTFLAGLFSLFVTGMFTESLITGTKIPGLTFTGTGVLVDLFGKELGAVAMSGILAGIFLFFGIITIVFYYWLWKMKKIGWILVMIMNIIDLIIYFVGLGSGFPIFSVLVILYFWWKKDLFS